MALELVGVDQELDHIIVVNILHKCVLAQVLETVEDISVGKAEKVQSDAMVEVLDAACVQVLHHVEIARVGPVLDLDLCLSALLHAIHEHTAEVLALRGEDGLVSVDRLLLNKEDDVGEGRIVDNRPHVDDQVGYGLVVDLVLFKFADIEDANVVQPLAPVEAAEDEQLLGANHAGRVALSARRSFLEFEWVRPTHRFSVQYIKVVRGNDLFEAAAAAIITTEQVDLVSDQVGRVTAQALRRTTADLRLGPAERFCVKDMQVL